MFPKVGIPTREGERRLPASDLTRCYDFYDHNEIRSAAGGKQWSDNTCAHESDGLGRRLVSVS